MPTDAAVEQDPDEFVEVKVQDGWLTLSGTVTYQFESDGAYDDVAGAPMGLGNHQ
jgi:osmotically-inducible protein OsmY